ncbi:outer membrane protein [Yoonia sp. BS5-3]|uniref:Outer membrane protein n=1 Tax=Yoonia phaeophyticola TaxID=3137369 RepID=A0ABZ3IEL2_9RHOB
MKNLFTTAAFIAAVSTGSMVQGQDWYGSVFGAVSTGAYNFDFSHNLVYSTDSGYLLGGTIGQTIAPGIRAEAELSYSDYELDSYDADNASGDLPDGFDLSTTYLMGNIWYDIPSAGGSTMTPYVGGGLGFGLVNYTSLGNDLDTSVAAAYQLGAGVQVPAGSGMVDIGYRFKGTAPFDSEFEDSVVYEDSTTSSHNLQVGYVMRF